MRLLRAREGMGWQRYSHQIWAQNVNICHWLGQHTGLDLCPPASPEFTGPWKEMPRPLMVITFRLHPFNISHLFLNVKRHLPHLNFDFSTHIPSKIGRNCCEIEMRPAPLQSLMNSGHRSKLKIVLALWRCVILESSPFTNNSNYINNL